MELHLATRLKHCFPGQSICERYLDRLPLAQERRYELLTQVAEQYPCNPQEAMTGLHTALAGSDHPVDTDTPALASICSRLAINHKTLPLAPETIAGPAVQAQICLPASPTIRRSTMAPLHWPPKPSLRLFKSRQLRFSQAGSHEGEHPAQAGAAAPGGWQAAATLRRVVLLVLIIAQVYFSTSAMAAVLPYHGQQALEIAILILFAILSGWVSVGFWTAMMGFVLKLAGGDRYAISASSAADMPIGDQARTAIIMPICNENVARVFAGLRATHESLARSGELQHFDFFILSDSSSADNRVAEVNAWLELCREVQGFGHVFYRWRQHRVKRKSGNVADFCRRWGANYRYMVVLDADSVMSGECLISLVRLMEANPGAGIIQSAPLVAGRDTLYARMQQFASRVYGPIFVAGLHFWQLGESHYWGHNAILRVAPFMRHCALGRLAGGGPLSGEILSHDFVEAALMRRAGWTVWIAYDLPGSYEEVPPNLIDELKRDRRWCQGNLMNFRLLLANGVHPAHRAVFMTGAAAYVSAPLWFLFLLLSTAQLAVHALATPEYFTQPFQLFPIWPQWDPQRAIALFSVTAALLFLPKILSVMLIWIQGAKHFGGRLRLGLSMLIEIVFSALLAPIRMLFHTSFVLAPLLGRGVKWKSPPRENAETGWGEALRRHGWHTLLGLVWAGGVYWLKPSYLLWLLPVVSALMLSIPISVFSSRVSLGQRLRRTCLFLIPEELNPPAELRQTHDYAAHADAPPDFIDAVVDPATNALICATGVPRFRQFRVAESRARLLQKALREGPAALDAGRRMHLLNDPITLSRLHFEVWTSELAHPAWRNTLSQTTTDNPPCSDAISLKPVLQRSA
ncbi:glucans biosynthesis glucosyltransferase MdoH [Sulfuriferula sp. GW1]|uniref:glucans biosynthesis glucosyltransferase MdoH n=1 Tax=Sulfuriferula sp. GW1 TaxID=3345111 RepID=UPI0039B0E241